MGTRKPTVQELRDWAASVHQSEDYGRFTDAQVGDMIQNWWDVSGGYFKNKYGDIVEKPDERGPNTPAGYNGTGDWIGIAALQGLKPGQKGQTGAEAPPAPDYAQDNPLQRYLVGMLSSSGGFIGQGGKQEGAALQGGGVWWAPQSANYSLGGVTKPAPKPSAGGGGAAAGPEKQMPDVTSGIPNLLTTTPLFSQPKPKQKIEDLFTNPVKGYGRWF